MTLLSAEQLDEKLAELPNWGYDPATQLIHRHIKLPDYMAAVTLANQIAELAEAADHHPEQRISYGALEISMNTHDAGDVVTQKDIDLATQIEAVLAA